MAANQGSREAQYNLGNMYYEANGVDRDYEKAKELFFDSAKQGLPDAMFNLGVMYENGYGVPIDYIKAYMWFTLCLSKDPWFQGPNRHLNDLEENMTKIQIAEAKKLAREWDPDESTIKGFFKNLIK